LNALERVHVTTLGDVHALAVKMLIDDPATSRADSAGLAAPRVRTVQTTRRAARNLAGIDQNDASFLRHRAAGLAEQYERFHFPLGDGPIHG